MEALRVLLPLLLVLLVSLLAPAATNGYAEKSEAGLNRRHHTEGTADRRGLFILGRPKKVVKTEAGEVQVVSGRRWRGDLSPMHIGFINMQPNSLLIPQYIDANLILFVQRGEARVGWIHHNRLVEKDLRAGDVHVVLAGSAFYIVNTRRSQELNIICSVDASESAGFGSYGSFFIGGGNYPTSVLSGFEKITLTDALNITSEKLDMLIGSQRSGPIIYMNRTDQPHAATQTERKNVHVDVDEVDDVAKEIEGDSAWPWSALLDYVNKRSSEETETKKDSHVGSTHVYNIYDKKPSYRNEYGWSIAVNEHDYSPLRNTDVSVYLVNLTEGSMLAPHLNPRATEYGVVLRGSGTIQVVFPNGSQAMNAPVSRGDVFWVPRYFPFCQVASTDSPLELFGFTTSSRTNRPQFLAGESSVLRSMGGPELAAAFGISEEQLKELVESQREGVILPRSDREEQRVMQRKTEKKGKGKREEVLAMMNRFSA